MKRHAPPATLRMWLATPMQDEVRQMLWRLRRAKDVCHVAVMPDVHLARDVCVGTVLATQRLVYPAAIGGDIGCGMAALAFDAHAGALAAPGKAQSLLDALASAVPIIRRHRPWPCPWIDSGSLSDGKLNQLRDRDGRYELGTLGRGNHFLEFQEDISDGRLWLMVHTGSRCIGQAVRDHHVARGNGSSFGLRYLIADESAGSAYLHDMAWARGYAAMNRRVILAATAEVVRQVLGVSALPATVMNRDHNHVIHETHAGRRLWIHRKGASRARQGEPCLIPGSMGTASVHAMGRGQAAALCSSSHGAGRALSRESARRQVSVADLRQQMDGVHFNHRALDQLRDEAPLAYRDIDRVMQAQRELVRVVRRLRPLVSYKG